MGGIFFHAACCFPLLMSGTDAAKTITPCGWLGAYLKPCFFCNSVGQFVMKSVPVAESGFVIPMCSMVTSVRLVRFPL